MTVIAYKNGVLAADRCCSDCNNGHLISLTRKIHRLPNGVLYGAAGDSDDRALIKLLKQMRRAEHLPSLNRLRDISVGISALVVFRSGKVWAIYTNKNAGVEPIDRPFAAIGSGGSMAIGAMAAGASAMRAVEICCDNNVFCRPPIDALKLDD